MPLAVRYTSGRCPPAVTSWRLKKQPSALNPASSVLLPSPATLPLGSICSARRRDLALPLIVVPTPIGNLEDITLRALRALREADVIACEDTRRTGRLLAHYEIEKPLLAYHEHNEERLAPELAEKARASRVALVTDAGTPDRKSTRLN